MPFIGNQPAESYSAFQKQDFSTSATTSYTLDHPVANGNEIALFINFVRQEPTAAYTASGTSLTLTSATSSSDDMYCVFLGKAVQTVNPPSGSVGTSQLASSLDFSSKTITLASNMKNTPNFFVNLSSTQSIPNATSTKVQLNQVLYDSDSGWSTSNYNYTIPTGEAGMYLFTFQCRLNNWDTARFGAHFVKNSTTIAAPETAPDGASYSTAGASIVIDCAAGDVIHLQFFHENGSSQNAYASSTVYGNYLGGYKLIGV